MKVLVINDRILFAEGMWFLLDLFEDGVDTLHAENFDTAVDVISKEGQSDLILWNMNLAKTNDFALIKEFQKLSVSANTIKAPLHKIFGELNEHNRSTAVLNAH